VAWSVGAARQVNLAHPGQLVTTGPYARTRNPMYAGWALLHAGAGVAVGSGWLLATLPAAAALVHRQVRREEQRLAADFGDEFERYQGAVPRYLRPRSFTSKADRGARGGLRQPAGADIPSL
jgi:protein-S-isoprenylcysteine O-methyltransferase Ste14